MADSMPGFLFARKGGRLLERIKDLLVDSCEKAIPRLPPQLLHFDANLNNLTFNGSSVGILDFNKLTYGPRVFEVIPPIRSDYVINDKCGTVGLLSPTNSLVAGYVSFRPLDEEELAAMPFFFALSLFEFMAFATLPRNQGQWTNWLRNNGYSTLCFNQDLLE